jgi:tetrahydromethanopterin S-methyltransferase subunit A
MVPPAFRPTNPDVSDIRREVESTVTNGPQSRFDQPRSINVSSGTNNEVFELARRLSADTLAESAARTEYEHMKRLHENRAISDTELRQHAAELEQAVRQATLARFQWEAMSKRLKRDLQYAERRVELTMQQVSEARSKHENGVTSGKEVLDADGAVELARKTLDDLSDKLEQLGAAEKLMRVSDESAAVVESQVNTDVGLKKVELKIVEVNEEKIEADDELSPSTDSDSDTGTSESLPPATR